MLSARKIGAGQVDYYVRYAARGAETFWLGRGAQSLGLSGGVVPEQFLALSRGEGPEGGRLLERVAADRTPGWDMTLSAPKSVSLAWALANEELRARIAQAHRDAVAATFAFLEEVGGRARRGLGGRDGHVEAGLAIACFTHPASRELDPQLHTHGIVLNVAHGADTRWTALDSRTLYLHRRAAGVLYRAELRERMAALGGVWEPLDRRGLAELAGFDTETLRAFSQRRSAIEEMLERSGATGRQASEAACLATRHDKVEAELEELREHWGERADALGWDEARVHGLLDGTDRRAPLDEDAVAHEAVRLVGPRGLTRDRAAFTRDDALVAWAETHRQGARREVVERLAEETLHRAEIVPLAVADADGTPLTTGSDPAKAGNLRLVRAPASSIEMLVCEPRYSTAELLATESHILELAARGQGAGRGRVEPAQLERVLAARPFLSNEQVAMVRAICSSGDACSVVVGVPGSGKTFALEAARAAWRASGFEVIGASLAAEAANQLEAGSKIPSVTLDRLLYELALPKTMTGQRELTNTSVIVVDEASMVDTRRLRLLLDHAALAGAKVVLTGDDRQLPSIEAGGGFAALSRRIGASRLTDNARQVEQWEREALHALREGRTAEAAGEYRRHGRIHLSDTPGDLLTEMVSSWWRARESGDDAVLYAYSRDATRVLNHLARVRAEDEGRLSGEALTVSEWAHGDLALRAYRVGDEVCCLRNRTRLGKSRDPSGKGLRNGTRGRVVALDLEGGELTLATNEVRTVRLPREYVQRYTDYGYAWTLHKGQGQTVGESLRDDNAATRRKGRAFVYDAESLTAEAALVAGSRATDSTELYVLIDPGEPPGTPTAEAEGLGRAWARGEHQHLALEELEAAREIARLAASARRGLVDEREALVALIGPGPAADLLWREDDARRRLGAALVQRDESIATESSLQTRVANSEDAERDTAREDLRAVRRVRAVNERETRNAAEDMTAAEHAIVEQARVRRARGSDVRSALDRLEVVDSALASARRRQIETLCDSPPEYVTGLLGERPLDHGRELRWQQGLVEIEDWRRNTGIAPVDEDEPSPWVRALGSSLKSFDERRRRRLITSLRAVRRDLGIETERSSTAQLKASPVPSRPTPGRHPELRDRMGHARVRER